MGSNHKYLVFQALVFVLLNISSLIKIAAICSYKISGVINNDCSLTFENSYSSKSACA